MKNTSKKRREFFSKLASIDELVQVFDLLPECSFFVKDRQGRFMALNQRGCEYCGVESSDEAYNKTDHDFFSKPRADEYRADDITVMESGEPIINRVESAPEGEGSPRLVITSKIPLKDQQGRVVGVAGFSRAIEQLSAAKDTNASFAKVVEHIHRFFDQKLTSAQLATMAGLSASQFERRFHRAFGCSARQYLMRIRIEKAVGLLAETDSSISDIAHACGFYDHAHFNRTFGNIMSMSPTQYRRSLQPPVR